jgi:hypothetical protein
VFVALVKVWAGTEVVPEVVTPVMPFAADVHDIAAPAGVLVMFIAVLVCPEQIV